MVFIGARYQGQFPAKTPRTSDFQHRISTKRLLAKRVLRVFLKRQQGLKGFAVLAIRLQIGRSVVAVNHARKIPRPRTFPKNKRWAATSGSILGKNSRPGMFALEFFRVHGADVARKKSLELSLDHCRPYPVCQKNRAQICFFYTRPEESKNGHWCSGATTSRKKTQHTRMAVMTNMLRPHERSAVPSPCHCKLICWKITSYGPVLRIVVAVCTDRGT